MKVIISVKKIQEHWLIKKQSSMLFTLKILSKILSQVTRKSSEYKSSGEIIPEKLRFQNRVSRPCSFVFTILRVQWANSF